MAAIVGLVIFPGACQHSSTRGKGTAPKAEEVTFSTRDGGLIHGNLSGKRSHAVVLVHGGRFNKESWADQTRVLTQAGMSVLAIDLRGYGKSQGGNQSNDEWEGYALDVLGAVRFLHEHGLERVSVVGGSMGGWAAARASVLANEGEIDRLVLISHSSIEQPQLMKGRKLFISSEQDPFADGSYRLRDIREQYERAPEPKELLVVEGDAHGQNIFGTPEGDLMLGWIVKFLTGE